ncbi:MAG: AI-2E family transporter [Cyclobacteriaceae bacterium]|nr:AI-2E family transporter [Cyclobacteriaceae bacterium]MCH8516356.1 AI-2E family transporter [Cyclobacteriaceae bacterium]
MSGQKQQPLQIPPYLKAIFILVGLTFLVHFLISAQDIVSPLLIAIYLSFLLKPIANFLEKWKFPRFLSVLSSVLVMFAATFLIGYFFYSQGKSLSEDLSDAEENIKDKIEQIKGKLPNSITEDLSVDFFDNPGKETVDFFQSNFEAIGAQLSSTLSSLTILFLVPLYVFFMLYYRDFLEKFFLKAFAKKGENKKMVDLIGEIQGIVQSYLVGMFLVILVLFALNSIMLLSFGLQHAILFAAFAAMLNIIPFVGPLIGSVVPVFFAFVTMDSSFAPLGIFIGFVLIQTLESNLITPLIVGGRVSMNPLITLVSLFVGNAIWGVIGMIIIIPTVAIIKEVFDRVEGLEAYGFLLGNPKSEDSTNEDGIFQKIGSSLKKAFK